MTRAKAGAGVVKDLSCYLPAHSSVLLNQGKLRTGL
jgi:hypothetical protein